MRFIWTCLAALTLATALVYAAIGAETAVFSRFPLAAVGAGLIGLGVCLDIHRRQRTG